MNWLVVLVLVVTGGVAEAAKNVALKRWAAKKAALNASIAARTCELKLMDIEALRKELLEAMGAADKLLLNPSVDANQISQSAEEIRLLANVLIQRTSSNDRLGLEAFVFARDIEQDVVNQNDDATK